MISEGSPGNAQMTAFDVQLFLEQLSTPAVGSTSIK
jgi:hypothetical protein